MRLAPLAHLLIAALAALAPPAFAQTRDTLAGAPVDISVTIYRDPHRAAGGFDLDQLNGFALITETRRVVLAPGTHRLRFEGVADGIDPATAIITGLPSGVVEKNRDALLLSPSALVEAAQAQGGRVLFTRANPATGALSRREGVIRAGPSGGVVLETPDGIEALRCSGLPETFDFEAATTGLSALPTLSVLTRTTAPVEAVVQLSYLSRGFDWAADYVGSLQAGSKTLDLGAWVTLANSNGVGFRDARVQIIAGRLNRESGEIEPIEFGDEFLAQCWPQETTSSPAPPIVIERAFPLGFDPNTLVLMNGRRADRVTITGSLIQRMPESAMQAVDVISMQEEALGDLKLYRVPDRTTIASRQSKQVRLMDKAAVPVTRLYEADFVADRNLAYTGAQIILRTMNNTRSNLGLALPSGRVALFETVRGERLLSAETGLRDLAIDEEVELRLARSPDVQVRQVLEQRQVAGPAPPPLLPGIDRARPMNAVSRVEITNARPFAVEVEVRLLLTPGAQVASADRLVAQKNGRPIFRLTVPANGAVQVRYQTSRP